ncbi:MAG TPA: arginine--tRNA ligase [Ignavibacteria bacterium]
MKSRITEELQNSIKDFNLPDINIQIEYAKEKKFGDFSCNIPMILSKLLKRNPQEIAEEIISRIKDDSLFKKIEIAGSGFINFFMQDELFIQEALEILIKKDNYGKNDANSGKNANLEWVSANPTGLLHAGHGRQVCLGKAIANLLEWSGYKVTREYYYNDAGNQMKKLAESVRARYIQMTSDPEYSLPEEGYHADTVIKIAENIKRNYTQEKINIEDFEFFQKEGEKYYFWEIKETLAKLGIKHNIFFSESSLYESGEITELLKIFETKNLIYKKDDAVWLKMTGEVANDKVIIKATGEYTYRLPDMAYHINKINRGYDLMVDIFGSDHKETYKEVLHGVNEAGYDIKNIIVIIHQMVTFKEGEKSVKMSKRSDKVYYLNDLLEDVGIDATQFFFVMRSANTHLVFDVSLAKEQSDKNPVYYLQYAYARICGILRHIIEEKAEEIFDNIKIDLLNSEEELDLIKILTRFPDEVFICSKNLEPHKLITYLNSVAEFFHKFYHNYRVLNSGDDELTNQRLKLCKMTKQVLQNGFDIIGISAPERM